MAYGAMCIAHYTPHRVVHAAYCVHIYINIIV